MKKIQLLAAAFIIGGMFSSTSLMAQDEDGNGPGGDGIVVVDPSTGEEIDLDGLTDEEIEEIFGDIFDDGGDGPGDDFPGGSVIIDPETGEEIDLEGLTDEEIEAILEELFGDDGNGPGDDFPGGGDWDPGDGLDFEWDWDWDMDDDGVTDDPMGGGDEPLTAEDIEAIFGPGAELPDGFTWADLSGLTDDEWTEYTTYETVEWEELTDEELEELFGDEFTFTDGDVFGVPGGIDEEWFDEDYIIDFEEELTDEEIEALIGEETYVFTEEDIEELYEEFVTLFGDDFITYEEFLDGFAGFLGTEASERLSSALSIDESAVANFNVYPNPATDVLNVDLALNDGNTASIVVTNLAGQTVYALNNVNSKQAIQLNGLTAGIYTVRLTVAQEDVQVLKFVKQ